VGVPREILERWEAPLDLLIQFTGVSASLVTRVEEDGLRLLVGRPAGEGMLPTEEMVPLFPSSYCQEVIRRRDILKVKDGREDSRWKDSPLTKRGLVSYMGVPLLLPGGGMFGTLSVMDHRPRVFPGPQEALLAHTRDLLESQLFLLDLHGEMKKRSRLLKSYQDELRQLREVFPVCFGCGKVRNDGEYWDAVEDYLAAHATEKPGQGVCPECSEKHWGESLLDPEPLPIPRGLGISRPAEA
jgi:transcriptional regulator with GAF, ATPase, and Fis domain